MDRAVKLGLLAGVLIVGALVWWFHFREAGDAPQPPPPAEFIWPPETTAPAEAVDPGPPKYPVPQPDEAEPDASVEPLPPMEESDEPFNEAVNALPTEMPLGAFLVPSRLIQRLVVTLNSLDGEMAPLRMWPLVHVPGVPQVREEGRRTRWSSDNFARYTPYVDGFTAVEAAALVRVYLRFYPLLQQAYGELGLPEAHFNDRVVDIIDHLLDAPDAPERMQLVQPKVLYRFADEELEALSAGHKILLRMGPENAARVRRQLRAIRSELVTYTGSDAADTE